MKVTLVGGRFARTQGSKKSGLWEVVEVSQFGAEKILYSNLTMRGAVEMVWRMATGKE